MEDCIPCFFNKSNIGGWKVVYAKLSIEKKAVLLSKTALCLAGAEHEMRGHFDAIIVATSDHRERVACGG